MEELEGFVGNIKDKGEKIDNNRNIVWPFVWILIIGIFYYFLK